MTEIDQQAAEVAGLDPAGALRRSGLGEDEVAYYTIVGAGPAGRRLRIAVMLDPVTAIPLHLVGTDRDPSGEAVRELRILHADRGVERTRRREQPPSDVRTGPPR